MVCVDLTSLLLSRRMGIYIKQIRSRGWGEIDAPRYVTGLYYEPYNILFGLRQSCKSYIFKVFTQNACAGFFITTPRWYTYNIGRIVPGSFIVNLRRIKSLPQTLLVLQNSKRSGVRTLMLGADGAETHRADPFFQHWAKTFGWHYK